MNTRGQHSAIIGLTLLMLAACSSGTGPAPVVTLSTTAASKENLTYITGDTYKVQAGDTLFAVAFYSGNDYRDIAKINKLSAPYTINIGQTLQLVAPKLNTAQQKPQAVKIVQKTHKIVVDSTSQQGYGKQDRKRIRQRQQIDSKVPINANKKKVISDFSWIWPATGNKQIATVGSDGGGRGLDIKGRLGSKIVATADGKIVYAGNALKGYGNLIIIKHNDEYLSAYAHNQAILVDEQAYVKQGQQIATMGNSGASEVMLHFEIRKKGKSVDPFDYLSTP